MPNGLPMWTIETAFALFSAGTSSATIDIAVDYSHASAVPTPKRSIGKLP